MFFNENCQAYVAAGLFLRMGALGVRVISVFLFLMRLVANYPVWTVLYSSS